MTVRKNIRNVLATVGVGWLLYRTVEWFRGSITNLPTSTTDAGIRSLVKQTARWSLAAQQDENPMVGVLHANYGVGYWSALRSLATLEHIAKAARIDPINFEKRILNVQATATRKLFEACPRIIPHDHTLTFVAQGNL